MTTKRFDIFVPQEVGESRSSLKRGKASVPRCSSKLHGWF